MTKIFKVSLPRVFMNVIVGVPTYRNNGSTIGKLMESLTAQTERDFKVIVIMKNGDEEGDRRTLDVLDRFSKNLDVKVVNQREGLFEEALGILFHERGDIYLTTDDDATVSSSWVQDHLRTMENERIGVATGEIEGHKWINYPNLIFDKFRDKEYMEPYSDVFIEYQAFLTKTGLSVDRAEGGPGKSLAIAGVNMSVKKEVIQGYSPLAFTLRGTYNESLIALNGIKKGLHSVVFKGGKVSHIDRESLSRTRRTTVAKYLALERFVLPYGVNRVGFRINTDLLRRFIEEIDWDVAKEGLSIALRGIEEGMEPKEIRELLADTRFYKSIKNGQVTSLGLKKQDPS
jgi:glycosyltransferase involved in cell wall biosynthesis